MRITTVPNGSTGNRRLHHSVFVIKVTVDAFPAGIEINPVSTEDRTPELDETVVPSDSNGAAGAASDDTEKTQLPREGDSECTVAAPVMSQGASSPGNDVSPENATMVEAPGLVTGPGAINEPQSADTQQSAEDRFKLVDNFARGGLGKIWLATDGRIRREVAFKELLPKALKSPIAVSRFLEEAQITGQLEHPGIVPIYELGFQSNGTPYYAMKLVRGETFEDAIAAYHQMSASDPDRNLVFTRLLRNFIDICNTLAFSHDHNVLHRDLKPHNVMLGQFGETLVLDWGLAKVINTGADQETASTNGTASNQTTADKTDADNAKTEQLSKSRSTGSPTPDSGLSTEAIGDEMTVAADLSENAYPRATANGSQVSLNESVSDSGITRREVSVNERTTGTETQVGAVLGTPAYMSPEQAHGEHDSLDARSDIYALGAILYRLLTNTTPYGKGSVRKIIKRAKECEYKSPREHDTSIDRALEAICLKAMKPNIDERYVSALDLKADVESWLADEPVVAYPDPLIMRLRRWIRRYRTGVLSAVAVLVTATVAPFAIETARHVRLTDAVMVRFQNADEALSRNDYATAVSLLDEASGLLADEPELSELASQADRKRARIAATMSEEELAKEKRLRETAEVNFERAERERKRANRNFVIASAQRLVAESKAVRQSHPRLSMLLSIEAVELSRRRKETVVPEALQNLHDVAANFGGVGMFGHTDQILDSAISSDGRLLLTGSRDRTAMLWDFPLNGTTELTGHEGAINCVALPAGDRWAVTAGDDADVVVWDLTAADINDAPIVLEGHELPVTCLAVSPDGRWLVTSGVDADIRLWDLAADNIEKSVRLLKGHEDTVNQLCFHPSGQRLVSAGESGTVMVWSLNLTGEANVASNEPIVAEHQLKKHTSGVLSLAVSPSGNWLVSGDAQGSVFAWDLQSDDLTESFLLTGHRRAVTEIAFPRGFFESADQAAKPEKLATAGTDGNIIVWQLADSGPRMIADFQDHEGAVNDLLWDSPATTLISAGDDRTVRLFRVAEDSDNSEQSVTTLLAHEDAVWSLTSDGDRLMSGSLDGALQIWDLHREEPGMVPVVLRGHRRSIRKISGSYDDIGLLALSSDRDLTWSLWNRIGLSNSLRAKRADTPSLHSTISRATAVARHFPSDLAAVAGSDGTILLLNSIDGVVSSVELKGTADNVNAMTFSTDGRQLITIGDDGVLSVVNVPLDASVPNQQASESKSVKLGESDLVAIAAARDQAQYAIGTEDGGVFLWSSGDEWQTLPGSHRATVNDIVFNWDGSLLASVSEDRSVRVWKRSADGAFGGSPLVLVQHEERIRDAAFSSDGNSLLTVSDDATAILWPLRSENPEAEAMVLVGHESAIYAGLLTGAGRWAITGSDDGTVRLWDLLSENPSASAVILHHFDEPVRALDLMNQTNTSTLVVGTRDGDIFVWPLSPQELIDRVRQSAGRSLTPEEVQQFKTTTGGLDESDSQEGNTNSSQSE